MNWKKTLYHLLLVQMDYTYSYRTSSAIIDETQALYKSSSQTYTFWSAIKKVFADQMSISFKNDPFASF